MTPACALTDEDFDILLDACGGSTSPAAYTETRMRAAGDQDDMRWAAVLAELAAKHGGYMMALKAIERAEQYQAEQAILRASIDYD